MRLAAVLLPLCLLLAGCSASSSTASAPAITATKEVAAKSAAPVKPATPATATCKDAKGDGEGFDIRRVTMARVGDDERITLTLAHAPDFSMQESASVVASFFDATGNHGGVFTTKWLPGETSVSVFDLDTTQNTYVDDLTVQSGKTITLSYPAKLIDRAGDGWVWTIATTLDGADVDSCSIGAYKDVIGA